MKETEKIILNTDDEAAKFVTVSGWASRGGKFWGSDEKMARWSGCTHLKCECGSIMERRWTKCKQCRHTSGIEIYNNFPYKEWDMKSPLYSDTYDKYFFSQEELDEYIHEEQIDPSDMRLMFCKENYFNKIPDDYWSDIMPDDSEGELPESLSTALNELNEVIENLPPCSYSPGTTRTSYTVV